MAESTGQGTVRKSPCETSIPCITVGSEILHQKNVVLTYENGGRRVIGWQMKWSVEREDEGYNESAAQLADEKVKKKYGWGSWDDEYDLLSRREAAKRARHNDATSRELAEATHVPHVGLQEDVTKQVVERGRELEAKTLKKWDLRRRSRSGWMIAFGDAGWHPDACPDRCSQQALLPLSGLTCPLLLAWLFALIRDAECECRWLLTEFAREALTSRIPRSRQEV